MGFVVLYLLGRLVVAIFLAVAWLFAAAVVLSLAIWMFLAWVTAEVIVWARAR